MGEQVAAGHQITSRTVALLAFACGATTANVYYAQVIVAPIAETLQISPHYAGLIVMATQLGYGLGLFFLVCLADIFENRRLVLATTAGTVLALVLLAISRSALVFFVASLLLGFLAVGSQILLPLAVRMTPESSRGKVIGIVMAGLVTGIMLARPVSSALTAFFGWRSVFAVSAALMAGVWILLATALPAWCASHPKTYADALKSVLHWLTKSRPLQRRAVYQGSLFAVFNMFWTAIPWMLKDRFDIGNVGLAVFAFAGAAGVFSAPVAGMAADRGHMKIGTLMALSSAAVCMLLSGIGGSLGFIFLVAIAAVLLDAATQANHVIGQRVVQGLDAHARGSLNAAYMTVIFVCGAIGSSLASVTYFNGGWWLTVGVGVVVLGCALAIANTER